MGIPTPSHPQGSYTVYMALARRCALLLVIAMLPLLAFAQEDQLRAAIRADIMSDPRSSEMAPAEIDAMVDALATQAEEQGVAQEYLDSENETFAAEEIPVYYPESPWDPMAIAILALVVVLAGVALFLLHHRKSRVASIGDEA